MQNFFKDYPNGAFSAHDSELRLNAYSDKKDINYINPDIANIEFVGVLFGVKAVALASSGIKAVLTGGESIISRQAVTETAKLFALGVSGRASEIIPALEKLSKTEAGRNLIAQMHNFSNRLVALMSDGLSETVMMNIQDLTRIFGE
jgi:hypothetical protein